MINQPQKTCPQCGEFSNLSIQYCGKCGHKFSTVLPMDNTQIVYTQQPQQQMYAYKSRMIAGLLGIFFGHLGIHRFYLGDVNKGIIFIILTIGLIPLGIMTCGLACFVTPIWGLIEGIMILTGSINCDAKGNPLVD